MAAGRPGGIGHPLELKAGYHVVISPVSVLSHHRGVEGFKAGGHNYVADLYLYELLFLIEVDGLGLAGGQALLAVGADAAVKAALGLGYRRLFTQDLLYLVEGTALGSIQHRHLGTVSLDDTLFRDILYLFLGFGTAFLQVLTV